MWKYNTMTPGKFTQAITLRTFIRVMSVTNVGKDTEYPG